MMHDSVGLVQLKKHCTSVYPPQTQIPFLMSTTQSFIKEGGSDPLDLIHIYKNEGDSDRGIPQHWHYVSFGLSDIYNYSYLCYLNEIIIQNPEFAASIQPLPQIYPKQGSTTERLSGFGFELTFRVKCNSPGDWNREPPKWPALVMQALAKYVFQSKNVFSAGDHVAWHCSLDGEEDSRIEHMLMSIDPQLQVVETDLGKVRFIQLVGVCQDELQASREWNVKGILEMMKERSETGGEYLVTDMRRGESIFELDPEYRERFNRGITEMGSDLASISAKHKYSSSKPKWFKDVEENDDQENDRDDMEIQDFLSDRSIAYNSVAIGVERGNFSTMTRIDSTSHDQQPTRCGSRMSYESESNLMVENAELADTRYYDNVYILLSYESAKVLPVVLNGRLAHRRQFTYQSLKGDLCTTFVPEGVKGKDGSYIESLVSREQPLVKKGFWLQIYVSDDLRKQMYDSLKADFDQMKESRTIILPKNYSWPEHKLHITVVEEIE